jgi:uracil-DNA glycosylase family 4
MNGFFDLSEMVTESTDHLCHLCGLNKTCSHPCIEPSGDNLLDTLIIAEAPGEEEDRLGTQLKGDVGQFFRLVLEQRELDLDRDFKKTNALRCRPPKNREPDRIEISSCYPHIEKLIREIKPRFIWLMGKAAIESYFMSRFSTLTPSRWRGLCIPDFTTGAWVIPLFHPSYAKRNERDPLLLSQYIRDLDFAINCIKTKPPINSILRPDLDSVRIIKDYDEICDNLEELILHPPEYLFHDYETTGIKPYRAGHKIATVSYSVNKKAVAFPMQHDFLTPLKQRGVARLWKKVLLSHSKKVAHNIPFEDVWARIILDTPPVNWHQCTMTNAHIIDNRQNYTGLKFQSFIHWGLPDYGKEINPFLKNADDRGFNKVMEAPLNSLLKYGAIDSLVLEWLFYLQQPLIDSHLSKGQDLFTEGDLAFADMQINGINADAVYYKNSHIELEQRIEQRKRELLEFEECKLFLRETGREINLGSSDDLRLLFFTFMKFEPTKKTDKGTPQVDADSLAKIKSPLAQEITSLAKIKKVDGTYIKQFIKEMDDDNRIHPIQDLNTVRTYRAGCSRPNITNVPTRNEEAKRLARSGIKPSSGWIILDFDYKANEVKAGTCYTKDPELITYCTDPNSDMHRDEAVEIFVLPDAPESYWKESKTGKKLRFYTKNGFVFPEWYGSYYKNCATNIWRECRDLKTPDGITVSEHLQNVGIIKRSSEALDFFIRHVKNVEQEYWERFNVFKKWQEEHYKQYEKTGIVELWTGFRCKGYLGRNELVNYLFQGTAFHWLLWSIIQINAEFRDRKMKSKVIAQIHDNAIIDSPPEEKGEVISLCTEIATQRIKEQYSWIIVPLEIEWEETAIDGSWYSKKDLTEEEED